MQLSSDRKYDKWKSDLLIERWGSAEVVTTGKLYDASKLPFYVCLIEDEPAGLITYRIEEDECEIISLDSIADGEGVGSFLIQAVEDE